MTAEEELTVVREDRRTQLWHAGAAQVTVSEDQDHQRRFTVTLSGGDEMDVRMLAKLLGMALSAPGPGFPRMTFYTCPKCPTTVYRHPEEPTPQCAMHTRHVKMKMQGQAWLVAVPDGVVVNP